MDFYLKSTYSTKKIHCDSGFTIVELLVVIVVIGILAAITVVSYLGISSRATVASLSQDLSGASNILKLDYTTNASYPATLATANNGNGINPGAGTTYIYAVNNSLTPPGFCLAATKNSTTYKITNDTSPSLGDCASYGLVLLLDPGNIASYPGSGSTWTDLSSSGRNATLYGTYNFNAANGGNLNFNGASGYGNYTGGGFLPTGNNVRTISLWFQPNAGMATSNIAFGYGCVVTEAMSCGSQGAGRYVGVYAYTTSIGLQLESCTVAGVATPAPTNGWHYFTAVFNPDTTITFYVDGGVSTVTRTPGCLVNTAAGVGYSVGVGRWGYFNGQIGKLSIYNRAFSSDEVIQNFDSSRVRYGL